MFVKKDTRKLNEILHDKGTDLRLGRREAEFGGSTKPVFNNENGALLANTKYLSLYGNSLSSLVNTSVLADNATEIEDLNVSLGSPRSPRARFSSAPFRLIPLIRFYLSCHCSWA